MKNLFLNIEYVQINEKDRCPMVNISTDDMDEDSALSYGNIYGMYKTDSTQGHGIQVNNPKLEQPYLKMCDKIAQAIYDCKKEIGDLK